MVRSTNMPVVEATPAWSQPLRQNGHLSARLNWKPRQPPDIAPTHCRGFSFTLRDLQAKNPVLRVRCFGLGSWCARHAMQACWFLAPTIISMAGFLSSPVSPALAAGAVATDAERLAFGSSVNRPTRYQAQKDAIYDCQRNGDVVCKIDREFSIGCFAVARRRGGWIFPATSRSLTDAEADVLRQCRGPGIRPFICSIEKSDCDATSGIEKTKNHLSADRLRQVKIPINWWTGLTAAGAQLLWLWHFIRQTALGAPAKAGLGVGVLTVQGILAYLLGSEGEIGLLEVPIFVLPLGIGEFVANLSFRRR
jgi:Domain of unknown function (DUF4189)